MTTARDLPLISQLRQAVDDATGSGEAVPLMQTLFLSYRHLYHAIRRSELDLVRDAARRDFYQAQIVLYNAGLDAIDAMSDALENDDSAAVGAALLKLEKVSERVDKLFVANAALPPSKV